ncbi:phage tail tube protein [uncultured Bradyrhizobium sp.]|uniref:phage tail tube protein n=1 Tax=uncultured Bradyrhizobium sp. TaxID=199684 RepID=UPI0035CC41D2
MAQPVVLRGTKLLILIGNGASPEVFSQPCGLTTRSFDLSAATATTLIPDCDNPDAPSWESKDITGLSAAVSGSGVMAVGSFNVWNDWFMSGQAKNVQIKLDDAALGHWSGQFILSSLKFGGAQSGKVTADISLVNADAVTWVAAS